MSMTGFPRSGSTGTGREALSGTVTPTMSPAAAASAAPAARRRTEPIHQLGEGLRARTVAEHHVPRRAGMAWKRSDAYLRRTPGLHGQPSDATPCTDEHALEFAASWPRSLDSRAAAPPPGDLPGIGR